MLIHSEHHVCIEYMWTPQTGWSYLAILANLIEPKPSASVTSENEAWLTCMMFGFPSSNQGEFIYGAKTWVVIHSC